MEKEKKENKWEDIGYYIGVNDIISVELKEAVEGSKIIKPKNGYWVKKSAIISNTTPKKETLSFEQFKKETPDIQSPFVGEEGIMYKAVYDKLTDRVQYFKNGRRNSTKITVKKAYDTYLFDNDKKMERGGEIESGMIVTFKDIYGDLHNGKVISKNNIKNAFDVVEISTQKEYLVSPSQIVS